MYVSFVVSHCFRAVSHIQCLVWPRQLLGLSVERFDLHDFWPMTKWQLPRDFCWYILVCLNFFLCETKPNWRENANESELLHWFGLNEMNYRCENNLTMHPVRFILSQTPAQHSTLSCITLQVKLIVNFRSCTFTFIQRPENQKQLSFSVLLKETTTHKQTKALSQHSCFQTTLSSRLLFQAICGI